jgi:hypothetical protein
MKKPDSVSIAFACFIAATLIFLSAVVSFAQTTPHVYPKVLGESVTFMWDHTPFQLACVPTGTTTPVLTTVARGQALTWTCNGRSYPVSWNAPGDTVTVGAFNADGSNYVAALSYRYQTFKIGPPETAGPTATQGGNQKSLLLDFGVCDLRMEVQSVRRVGTVETTSAWAKSTDPTYAVVDGVARGWIVRVATPPPPPPPTPGAVQQMRVVP